MLFSDSLLSECFALFLYCIALCLLQRSAGLFLHYCVHAVVPGMRSLAGILLKGTSRSVMFARSWITQRWEGLRSCRAYVIRDEPADQRPSPHQPSFRIIRKREDDIVT